MIVITLAILLLIFIVGGLFSTRTLMRIGTGYSAKTVCSGIFVSGRELGDIVANDVVAPGHPLLHLARPTVNTSSKEVSVTIAGAPWTRQRAIFRQGLGCTLLPDNQTPRTVGTKPWAQQNNPGPQVESLTPSSQSFFTASAEVTTSLRDATTIPGTRAIVVMHKGEIVAEYYAAGFDAEMPLLGWSLAKTVTALLAGILVDESVVSLSDAALFDEWSSDQRKDIQLKHLLHMESGLAFQETYGDISDVNRMLFLEPDMAGFTRQMDLGHAPGTHFEYTSGTTNLIINYLRQQLNDDERWAEFPQRALFDPLGLTSAVFETDAAGNFAGGSYLYATARDWATVGQLMLQRGHWNGRQLVSAEWIDFMTTPTALSGDEFGAHVWLRGQDGDQGFNLPKDTFWLLGHDGQSVAVIPSRELVVTRLGLTPGVDSFKPQTLVQSLLTKGILP